MFVRAINDRSNSPFLWSEMFCCERMLMTWAFKLGSLSAICFRWERFLLSLKTEPVSLIEAPLTSRSSPDAFSITTQHQRQCYDSGVTMFYCAPRSFTGTLLLVAKHPSSHFITGT